MAKPVVDVLIATEPLNKGIKKDRSSRGNKALHNQWLLASHLKTEAQQCAPNNMRITDVYSSSGGFLKADDITKPTTATIESVDISTRDYNDGKGERSQLVVTFVGKEKKLGLNFTNANKLAELTGSDDSDDWVGVTIKLHVEKVKVGTEMKPSIRIWPELPEQVTPEPKAEPTHTGKVIAYEDETDQIPF